MSIFPRQCNAYKCQNDTISLTRRRDITTNCGPDDAAPPNRVNTTERLVSLRALFADYDLAAYVVPLDEEGRRGWISGFDGSNGDAIVTADQAACWTDGRYFLQAADQLDCNWQLMRMGEAGVPTYAEWLVGAANLTAGDRVGADPNLIGAQTWMDLAAAVEEGGIHLVSVSENLIDFIWTEENGRPPFKVQGKQLVSNWSVYANAQPTNLLLYLRPRTSSSTR